VTPRVRLSAVIAVAALACHGRAAPPSATASLGGDVARVGDLTIPASLVAEVARAKGVTPRAGLELLVQDALAAQGALAEGLDGTPALAWASAAALARRVPRHLLDDARALGPATDDELSTVTVVHAVVLRSPSLSEPRGLATADAIERAVKGANSAADFEARAKAVPHPSARVTVERIENVGPDGRTPDGMQLDPIFVAEAFALRSPSDTSPIIETRFGWHVIRMVDRASPTVASLDERRRDLQEAVVQMRGRARLGAVLRTLKERIPIEIAPGAEALTAAVMTRRM